MDIVDVHTEAPFHRKAAASFTMSGRGPGTIADWLFFCCAGSARAASRKARRSVFRWAIAIMVALAAHIVIVAPAPAQAGDLDALRAELIDQIEQHRKLKVKKNASAAEMEAWNEKRAEIEGNIIGISERLKAAMKGRKDPRFKTADVDRVIKAIENSDIETAYKLAKAIPQVQKRIVRKLDGKVTGVADKTRHTRPVARSGDGPWSLGPGNARKFQRERSGRNWDRDLDVAVGKLQEENQKPARTGLEGFIANNPQHFKGLFRKPFNEFYAGYKTRLAISSQQKFFTNLTNYAAKQKHPKLKELMGSLRLASLPIEWKFLDGIGSATLPELEAKYIDTQKKLRVQLLTLKTPWSRPEDNAYQFRINALNQTLVHTEMQIVWILGFPRETDDIFQLSKASTTVPSLSFSKHDEARKKLKPILQKWADFRFYEILYQYYCRVSLDGGEERQQEDLCAAIKKTHKAKYRIFAKAQAEWEKYRKRNLRSVEGLFFGRMERGLKVALKLGKTFKLHVWNPKVRGKSKNETPDRIYSLALYGETDAYLKAGFFQNLHDPNVQKQLLLDEKERENFVAHSRNRPLHKVDKE